MKKNKPLFLIIFLIGIILFGILYYIYTLFYFTIYPKTDIDLNLSIDELCEYSLKQSQNFKQLKKFEFEVREICYRNYPNISKSDVEITLVSPKGKKNKLYYVLKFDFNIKENKLEKINGGFSDDVFPSMDYSNWLISSNEAIKIYENHLKQIGKSNDYIYRIDGRHEYMYGVPAWSISGDITNNNKFDIHNDEAITLLIDPYSGNIIYSSENKMKRDGI